jgi:hypothetical protein
MRSWLKAAVTDAPQDGPFTPEIARERMFLRVAFDGGGQRLETTAQAIEAVTGRRALEFVRGLDRQAAPVTEDDLRRYLLARSMRSREAATTAYEQQTRTAEWGLGLVKLLSEPRKNGDQKTIDGAARILPIKQLGEAMVARIEAESSQPRIEETVEELGLTVANPGN